MYKEGLPYEQQSLLWKAQTQLLYLQIHWGQLWGDKLPRELAWKLPRRMMYWAVVRGMAQATSGEWGQTEPSKLDVMTMLDRIDPRSRAGK